MTKAERNYRNLFIVAIIVLTFVMFLNLATYYWADDYGFIISLKKYGVLQNCLMGYNEWDGRFLSLGAFIQGFLLFHCPVELITSFWSICFLIGGGFIFYIVSEELELTHFTFFKKWFFSLFSAIVFWIVSFKNVSETIYWSTGGIYSFYLLQGAIWIYFFLKMQKQTFNSFFFFLFLLVSFTVGATSLNFSLGILTLIALTIFQNNSANRNRFVWINIFVFIFVLSGAIFISAAPGNFIRLKNTEDYSHLNDNFLFFIKNYFYVFIKYLYYLFPLIVISFLVNFYFFKNYFSFKSIKQLLLNKKTGYYVKHLKWLLVASSTVLPFIFIPNLASPRTVIFFAFFILLFLSITMIKYLRKVVFIHLDPIFFQKKSDKMFFSILLFSLFFICYNLYKGVILKNEILKREITLKDPKNKVVLLKSINKNSIPPCFQFVDLDRYKWILDNQQKYYKKKIIIKK